MYVLNQTLDILEPDNPGGSAFTRASLDVFTPSLPRQTDWRRVYSRWRDRMQSALHDRARPKCLSRPLAIQAGPLGEAYRGNADHGPTF